MKRIPITLLLILGICFSVFSQEIITGLGSNVQIKEKIKAQGKLNISNSPKTTTYLNLPFVDDFSKLNVFPDSSLWSDKFAFINADYALHPPTLGVATFDAINDSGNIYIDAASTAFIADYLTSNEIRLDSEMIIPAHPYKVSDSIYFSFYYQPQGIGNAPETDDSLVVEFYSPSNAKWYHAWSSKGMPITTFYTQNNSYFKQIMIPVLDSANFFQKGFKFRFKNYASLANNSMPSWAGNVDQWNVDYVYLNQNRNKADTVKRDVAFVEKAPSMLKNYQSMPCSQFLVNPGPEMKSNLKMSISNLDTAIHNYSYRYEIFDKNLLPLNNYPGGSWNIWPFLDSGLVNYAPHATPAVTYSFPCIGDSSYYFIKHIVHEGVIGDNRQQNDTTTFEQKFFNYYAYDDGNPEAGYGLTPANSKMAYRFTLNHPDTLRAIQMFFNKTYNNSNQQYFFLKIWSSLSPETVIYSRAGYKPQFEDSLNQFYTYFITDTTLVLSGTFYIGWLQTTDDNLNIGFDWNNDNHANIFYNVDGTWQNSQKAGSIMLRPVLGKQIYFAGLSENADIKNEMNVFPNPTTSGIINFSVKAGNSDNLRNAKIEIYDLTGRTIISTEYQSQVNVQNLTDGLYFYRIFSNSTQKSFSGKFIVEKE
ncbi:MAG: T9SS type A sorting domain-containing protein [Bacteroidetes bacterium]|nr:T9SS type A sorting domain-containing protein [Bacteroidota bacterium]